MSLFNKNTALHFLFFILSFSIIGQSEVIEIKHCIETAVEKEGQEAINALNQCYHNLVNNDQEIDSLAALIWHNCGNIYYRKFRNYAKAIEYWKKALAIRREILPAHHEDIARSHSNLSLAYQKLSEYKNAELHAQKCWEIRKNSKSFEKQAAILTKLGRVYEDMGDFNNAEQYYDNSISKLQMAPNVNAYQLAKAYQDKGILINEIGQLNRLPESIKNIQEAINIFKKDPIENEDYIADCRLNLGSPYHQLGKYDKAIDLYKQAGRYYKRTEQVENYLISLFSLGNTLRLKRDFQAAIKILKECLSISKESKFFSQAADACENLGETYKDMGNLAEALSFYQKSIQYRVPEFKNDDPYTNPNLKKGAFITSEPYLLTHLHSKANCLMDMDNPKALNGALATYKVTDDLLHLMKMKIQNQSSQLYWQEKSFPIYNAAIKVASRLNQSNKNPQYLQDLLYFSEKNKASILLDAIRNIEAQLTTIPQHLLAQEKQIKYKMGGFERQIAATKLEEGSAEVELDSLLAYREKYRIFTEALEQKYPAYYSLKYDQSANSIEKIQNWLAPNPNKAIIEYFIGSDSIYIFTISKEKFEVISVVKTQDFNKRMNALQKALKEKDFRSYTKTAYHLYEELVAPALSLLKDTKELIIIPDGSLNYIPFEALLTQSIKPKPIIYQDLPYLIRDFTITYAYSINLLLEVESYQPKGEVTLTAFAPEFQEDSDLGQLNNQSMVKHLLQTINGIPYLGKNATKENLLSLKDNHSILHISSHALMDDKEPLNSKIYLADDFITTAEIYNLPFSSALTVLSACETGTGQLQKGEGIMSLARAFMYAGCPSVLTSLWKVDDEQTNELMEYFYSNLKQGQNKAQALRNAKLTYLDIEEGKPKNGEQYGPFYWAAFIHIGQITPLYQSSLFYKWMILIGIGLLILLFFRKIKKSY